MDHELTIVGPHKDFENIKHIDENGVEFWLARELMPMLGYPNWQKSEDVINRALKACINSGQVVENHFNRTVKMVNVGSRTVRQVVDYKVDRYGCYLIAQNGDPNKSEVAQAQTYFAIQSRKQEIAQMSADQRRLFIRDKVKEENKKLSSTAKRAGVSNFGSFYDAGYRGLYGLNIRDLERVKGVKKGELMDRVGSTELAANLFRITQTDEKIRQNNIKGQEQASQTHFMVGGKIRQTIKDIGGVLPERLPVEKHIKEIKKGSKKLKSK